MALLEHRIYTWHCLSTEKIYMFIPIYTSIKLHGTVGAPNAYLLSCASAPFLHEQICKTMDHIVKLLLLLPFRAYALHLMLQARSLKSSMMLHHRMIIMLMRIIIIIIIITIRIIMQLGAYTLHLMLQASILKAA